MYHSINTRLSKLEHRPQNAIPAFRVEYLDGTTTTVYGATLIRYRDGVARIVYNESHQGAVNEIALYHALYPEIETKGESR